MTVSMHELGDPIATGRSAVLYRWPGGDDQVVKLYLDGHRPERVDEEEAASIEAYRLGLSGIACHGQVTVDGRIGLVLDRIDGISLTAVAERNPFRLLSSARDLADAHARVHAVSTDRFIEVREAAVAALTTTPLQFLNDRQRAMAADRIGALPSDDRVLHLDFHSENVFVHGGRHVVIDWQTAMRGAPAADVAMTLLLLRDAELWPGTPAWKRVVVGRIRTIVLRTYLRRYVELTGTTTDELDEWRLTVLILRLAISDIESERARFRAEVVSLLDRPSPTDTP